MLSRVRYRGEEFVVERGGEPICRIVPVGPPRFTVQDLVAWLRSAPKIDDGWADAVERATRHQGRMPRAPWGR